MPPETIAGRYRVGRAVGRGGMGTVWLCRDELLGRDVAVKQVGVLPGESLPDLARALREARTSAALNHPNVVSVFDAVEADDHIWLVMEYVPGSTLAELLAREGQLDPARVAFIGAQVADGLAAAHERGTVHRDVKPGNVLVTHGDVAKISDFGIARSEGDAQLTASGLLTGTPLYFSPELARGADPSPASDVWALGATLYAAVEGEPPIADRGNAIATLTAIAQTRPPLPEHAGFLADAIGRMLDPDPGSRWSMPDAAHALWRLHEQHRSSDTLQVPAVIGSPPPDMETAVLEALPAETDTAVVEAEPPRRRRSRWPVLVAALVVLLLGGIAAAVILGREPDRPSAGTDTPAASERTERGRSKTPEPTPTTSEAPPTTPAATPPSTTPAATPPSTTPATTPLSTPAAPTAAAGSPEKAVIDYYALLPEDTEGAWRMIGSDLQQEVGYDAFTGFWGTVAEVVVHDTSWDGDVVDVALTYTRTDGSEASETRELQMTPTDNGWLITGDEGP